VFGIDAFGFVDATNCGFVRFKQESNSTVDPRYSEHLPMDTLLSIEPSK